MYSYQEEKIVEKIQTYLEESSSGNLYNDRDLYSVTLQQNYRMFRVDSFNDSVNDIIGLYDPSAMNILTGKVSGILFLKERFIYKETVNSIPIAMKYDNIDYVVQKFSSLILYGKNGVHMKLKGISMSDDETYNLFDQIVEILR